MSKTPIVALGDIAHFIRGINFKPDDVVPLGTEGSVACMRTKNVQSELDLTDVWAVDESFVRRDEQLLQAGDILVSSANSWNLVGKCSWIPELPWRASFGGFVSVLRANPAHVDARFLYQWFSWEHTQALLRSFGQKTTNISNLNIERALALKLPCHPLEEQRRIAAILDQAETLRTQRRTALALLDSLTQSLFLDMFGDPVTNPMKWPSLPIRELGAIHTGKTPPSQVTENFAGEIPFVTPGDLDGDLTLTERSLSDSGAAYCTLVRAGSSLVSCIGSIGKVGRARSPTAFNQQINAVEWNDVVDDTFGLEALKYARPQMLSLSSATTLPILNKSNFSKVTVVVPPLPLQQTFTTRIASIEALKATHRRALAALDALFASLQQRAFAGQL